MAGFLVRMVSVRGVLRCGIRYGNRRRGGEPAQPLRTLTSVSGIDINVEEAWEIYRDAGSEKSETVIALIDTGVDTGHEDFGDVFWKNEDEIAGNGIDDDGNGYIDDCERLEFL